MAVGGGGGYLAVSFRFFSVLNELVFWLEYSRFALTLLQIYPEQASLSTDTYILHKRLSSAKNSRQLWTKLRRKSTTRARQQHPKLYCRAPYTAFSQKSTHFTNLGHHSHTSLDSIVYICSADSMSCWDHLAEQKLYCWDIRYRVLLFSSLVLPHKNSSQVSRINFYSFLKIVIWRRYFPKSGIIWKTCTDQLFTRGYLVVCTDSWPYYSCKVSTADIWVHWR